jgi:L-amino acid N-acyltransferase YncA
MQRVAIEYRWPGTIGEPLGAQVIALYNDSIRTENILGYVEPLSEQTGREIIERMDESVRRREKHFFGLFREELLIGMALLTPNSLPNCRHIVEWSKGIIHSQFRGRGLLKNAMSAMAARCLEMGWDVITLDVRAGSRSHELWSALGFKEYGRLPDYARIGGVAQPGAFMFAAAKELLRRNDT